MNNQEKVKFYQLKLLEARAALEKSKSIPYASMPQFKDLIREPFISRIELYENELHKLKPGLMKYIQ